MWRISSCMAPLGFVGWLGGIEHSIEVPGQQGFPTGRLPGHGTLPMPPCRRIMSAGAGPQGTEIVSNVVSFGSA
jgi:hypothetical protein